MVHLQASISPTGIAISLIFVSSLSISLLNSGWNPSNLVIINLFENLGEKKLLILVLSFFILLNKLINYIDLQLLVKIVEYFELTGDVEVNDWNLFCLGFSWVVHDNDMCNEVLSIYWLVVLWVSWDKSSLNILWLRVP